MFTNIRVKVKELLRSRKVMVNVAFTINRKVKAVFTRRKVKVKVVFTNREVKVKVVFAYVNREGQDNVY